MTGTEWAIFAVLMVIIIGLMVFLYNVVKRDWWR